MDELEEIINIFIALIEVGVMFRFIYICVATIMYPDTFEDNKKKLLFLIGCYIICKNIVLLKTIFLKYY